MVGSLAWLLFAAVPLRGSTVPQWAHDIARDFKGNSQFEMLMFTLDVLDQRRRSGMLARELDFVHMFSGADAPGKAVRKRGYKAASFDIRDDPDENLMTLPGLLYGVSLCFQIKPGGMAHFGPECSSFIWMSRGASGRRKDDLIGDTSQEFVRRGNFFVLLVSCIAFHLHLMQVFYSIEQPRNSLMPLMPAFVQLESLVKQSRFCTWLGAFRGHGRAQPNPKPVIIWTNAPLSLAKSHLRRTVVKGCCKGGGKAWKRVEPSSKTKGYVRGTKGLTLASAYPTEFGRCMSALAEELLGHRPQ